MGKLSVYINDTKLLIGAMGSSFAELVVLSFASTLSMVLLSAVLYGIGVGVILPIMNTILIKQCPANKRGAALLQDH